MRRRAYALLSAAVLLLVAQPLYTTAGSASQLRVDPGVLDTYSFDVDLEPQQPEVPYDELAVCGDPAAYDEIVVGTAGPDELRADNGRQILVGRGGDDLLVGGNHDDCLVGGDGDDVLEGGNGRDILSGGPGADLVDGGNGKDVLSGGGQAGDACVGPDRPGTDLDTRLDSCVVADESVEQQPAEQQPAEQQPAEQERAEQEPAEHERAEQEPAKQKFVEQPSPTKVPEPSTSESLLPSEEPEATDEAEIDP